MNEHVFKDLTVLGAKVLMNHQDHQEKIYFSETPAGVVAIGKHLTGKWIWTLLLSQGPAAPHLIRSEQFESPRDAAQDADVWLRKIANCLSTH